MAEPAASAVSAAGAAILSVSIGSLIGVDATTVGWSLAGGWFGASFAPKLGPLRAAIQFVLASLISALVATAAARYWQISEPTIKHLLAATVSMSFYVLKTALLARVGGALDRGLDRIFGAADQGQGGKS